MLLSRKDEAGAAKYYEEAGASGKYPKAYKFAIDIYLREKRYDQVEAMLSKIASAGGGDAQWAEYVKFSLQHNRWEQGGEKDTALEDQWSKDAQDYLQKNPNGEHAAEMGVALAERKQRQRCRRGGQQLRRRSRRPGGRRTAPAAPGRHRASWGRSAAPRCVRSTARRP